MSYFSSKQSAEGSAEDSAKIDRQAYRNVAPHTPEWPAWRRHFGEQANRMIGPPDGGEGSLADSEKIDRQARAGVAESASWDTHPGGPGVLGAVYREYMSRTLGRPSPPPPPRY